MNAIIDEINNSITIILDELLNKKTETEEALNKVNNSIKEKIDEAKIHKSEVDIAKDIIKTLEEEIQSLEDDLEDLNVRFGKKNLTSIIEAGNKEINEKIAGKREKINKQKQKISELTEKARSIKDLLINLKKDKNLKEERLANYTDAYNYYEKSLNKIINFADKNPDNLEPSEELEEKKIDYPAEESLSGVFDEIESIDNAINNNIIEEELADEIEDDADDTDNHIADERVELDNLKEEELLNINEEPDPSDEVQIDPDFLESLKKTSLELGKLEETIDTEYNNVFGSEEKVVDEVDSVNPLIFSDGNEKASTSSLIFEDPELITNKDSLSNLFKNEPSNEESKVTVDQFFKQLAIDFNRFDNESQNMLLNSFSAETFRQTIDVLVNNNIDLNNLYNAPNIFTEISSDELDKIISKLLLSGQTTNNIGLVIDSLASLNSIDLDTVINSYGPQIKDVNITDLIIKTKNLIEGGGL